VVRDGDAILIDIPARKLDLLVDQAEVERRLAAFTPKRRELSSPFLRRYAAQVSSTPTGAVLEG
jgi:dihydroxy-acid dehydratase